MFYLVSYFPDSICLNHCACWVTHGCVPPSINHLELLELRPQLEDLGHKRKQSPFSGFILKYQPVMRTSDWWRDHSPWLCDCLKNKAAYVGFPVRKLPGQGDSFHFLLLIQKTRLNMRERLSLLFLPKSCIPKERSCLFFFDSYWVGKWPESSINNFLRPIIWKQSDSFLIYGISFPL